MIKNIAGLLIALLCANTAFGAFAATTEWDVRTTGNDANGGGFNVAATGTDRSQSDTPFIQFTDLLVDAATATKITSAAHPFDSTSPGNIINITGNTGTGTFTVQRVQIVSVAGAVATCDKNVGSLGATLGTGNLGGSLATNATAFPLMVLGNTVWLQTGTYTITAAIPMTVGGQFSGYQTSHGDGGTAPLITTATDSVIALHHSGSNYRSVDNISFSNTASVRANCIDTQSSGMTLQVSRASFQGCATAIGGGVQGWANLTVLKVSIRNCTADGITGGGTIIIALSYIYDCANNITTAATFISITRTVIANGRTHGLFWNTSGERGLVVTNCTFVSNVGSGIYFNNVVNGGITAHIANNVFYGNTGYGVDQNTGTTNAHLVISNNGFGSNSTAAMRTGATQVASVTLTADPFVSAATEDFRLNSTAGGGAALKGQAIPGLFGAGGLDIGAVQTVAPVVGPSTFGYTQ